MLISKVLTLFLHDDSSTTNMVKFPHPTYFLLTIGPTGLTMQTVIPYLEML